MTRTERAKAWYDKQMALPYGKFDNPEFHMLGIMLDEVESYKHQREELLAKVQLANDRKNYLDD